MEKLTLKQKTSAEKAVESLYEDLGRRMSQGTISNCPVEQCKAFVSACLAQSCGKCVPCRIGLKQLSDMLDAVLESEADIAVIDQMITLASSIRDSADCAIGYQAADTVLKTIDNFRSDFMSHIENNRCEGKFASVPCVQGCPANVDIPTYIALVKEGRYKDAVRVIRYDNPLPAICALVCEHPCERFCRRRMIDDAINIRSIKRMAVDNAGKVDVPACLENTKKKIAVIGGGPSGLTCAYYLQLMGHNVTIFEKRQKLGGMTRYGIPRYRLPESYLKNDINAILSTGIKVELNTIIKVEEFKKLQKEYDAIYMAIGAHNSNKLNIEGEDAKNVLPAVDLLRAMGDNDKPNFKGKRVVVIGGGNVAMDCTRTARRLGAKSVQCVYRRRQEDMTALPEEEEGAIAEECELVTMKAPVRIETNENNEVAALIVQPQIPGGYNRGRPEPVRADLPEERIKCDVIVSAIGQAVDSKYFELAGIPLNRGKIVGDNSCLVAGNKNIYTGGDCLSGPSTVIKAVEAGKVAAYNIDRALGFNHVLQRDIKAPNADTNILGQTGRINLSERSPGVRKRDFRISEFKMSHQEAKQECSRCLRCDHFGFGAMCNGGNK